ncbi:type II secretion system protein GspG [Candidatus Sumerlaeota bacterium]|nr:type II secretion system protein GspG [Candidatus Sumerlaeota bacterium]
MEEIPRDAWGKPFEYFCPSAHDRSFDLISGGPDRKFQTEDDLHNWDVRNEGVRG